jgi:hypothetical protein
MREKKRQRCCFCSKLSTQNSNVMNSPLSAFEIIRLELILEVKFSLSCHALVCVVSTSPSSCHTSPFELFSLQSSCYSLFMWMLVVITFTSNEHLSLLDICQRRLEGIAIVSRDGEASNFSTIHGVYFSGHRPSAHLFCLWHYDSCYWDLYVLLIILDDRLYDVVSIISGTRAAIYTTVVVAMQRKIIVVLAYLGSQCTKFHAAGWTCWLWCPFI